ncbi:hypothetical protein CPB83DRAFT_911142 [Crepidotus variabilis]|uniref:Uncharacterized protein n=1 Tax=Crepidotus variabilis TaxID=179855 RepID=A0A9P6E560_9AGAR|nr:hypothetical protein CPB83DRAFT_911142 [Crepidotus variabilis]
MAPVVQHPDEPYHHHILQTCFGDKYQAEMPQIRQNIETLAKGEILIDKTLSKVYKGQTAVFVHSSRSIWLFDDFYRLDTVEGALAVVHEASHALLGTEDVFSKDGHFTVVKMTPYATPQGYFGYIDRDFKSLRAAAPAKTMVQNADSYRLLGHLALSGFQDLGHDHPMSDWVIEGVPVPEKPETAKKEPAKKKGWFS